MKAYSHEVKTWSNKLSVDEFVLEEIELVLGNSNEEDRISLEYKEERDDEGGERNLCRENILIKPISFTEHTLSDENIEEIREMNQDASRTSSIRQSDMTTNVITTMEINSSYKRQTEDDEWTSLSAASPLLWNVSVSSSGSSMCSTTITNMVCNDPEKNSCSSAEDDKKSLQVFNNVLHDFNSISQGSMSEEKIIEDALKEVKRIGRYDELYHIGKEKIRSDLQRYYIETRKLRLHQIMCLLL